MMDKQRRKVVHVQMNEKHEYYGSLAALFKERNREQIGYSLLTLQNMKLKEGTELTTSTGVVIRIGRLK